MASGIKGETVCHPEKKHKALGLCENCYAQLRRQRRTKKQREEYAAKARKRYRKQRVSKRYRDRQKDRGRFHRLKRYGLTSETYQALRTSQNELCACCGDSLLTAKRVHVDHDHKTGKVRALLCDGCNLSLGHFEREGWVEKAMQYLAKYK